VVVVVVWGVVVVACVCKTREDSLVNYNFLNLKRRVCYF
jgi:hypothetical protein